jgi:hypothetical protein
MQKLDFFSTLVLLLFSIYVAVASFSFGVGSLGKPGPGFFPLGGAIIVGVNALFVLSRALSKTDSKRAVEAEKTRWWKVAAVLGSIVLFGILMDTVGFFLCTFLMIVFFIRIIMSQGWPKTILVALCSSIGCYIIFDLLLNAQLPRGFLTF